MRTLGGYISESKSSTDAMTPEVAKLYKVAVKSKKHKDIVAYIVASVTSTKEAEATIDMVTIALTDILGKKPRPAEVDAMIDDVQISRNVDEGLNNDVMINLQFATDKDVAEVLFKLYEALSDEEKLKFAELLASYKPTAIDDFEIDLDNEAAFKLTVATMFGMAGNKLVQFGEELADACKLNLRDYINEGQAGTATKPDVELLKSKGFQPVTDFVVKDSYIIAQSKDSATKISKLMSDFYKVIVKDIDGAAHKIFLNESIMTASQLAILGKTNEEVPLEEVKAIDSVMQEQYETLMSYINELEQFQNLTPEFSAKMPMSYDDNMAVGSFDTQKLKEGQFVALPNKMFMIVSMSNPTMTDKRLNKASQGAKYIFEIDFEQSYQQRLQLVAFITSATKEVIFTIRTAKFNLSRAVMFIRHHYRSIFAMTDFVNEGKEDKQEIAIVVDDKSDKKSVSQVSTVLDGIGADYTSADIQNTTVYTVMVDTDQLQKIRDMRNSKKQATQWRSNIFVNEKLITKSVIVGEIEFMWNELFGNTDGIESNFRDGGLSIVFDKWMATQQKSAFGKFIQTVKQYMTVEKLRYKLQGNVLWIPQKAIDESAKTFVNEAKNSISFPNQFVLKRDVFLLGVREGNHNNYTKYVWSTKEDMHNGVKQRMLRGKVYNIIPGTTESAYAEYRPTHSRSEDAIMGLSISEIAELAKLDAFDKGTDTFVTEGVIRTKEDFKRDYLGWSKHVIKGLKANNFSIASLMVASDDSNNSGNIYAHIVNSKGVMYELDIVTEMSLHDGNELADFEFDMTICTGKDGNEEVAQPYVTSKKQDAMKYEAWLAATITKETRSIK